jgi:hypothetical protein
VATISNAAGSNGLATSVAAGTTTITAVSGSVSATSVVTVVNGSATPTVGAIRWDEWYGSSDSIGKQLNTDLGPNQFHYRLPFYTTELSSTSVNINQKTQAIMDQEIAYASGAGLNYFAFVWYPGGAAFNLYLNSTQKTRINYCLILDVNALQSITSLQGQLVTYFQDSSYQKVLTNRPLVYVFQDGGVATPDLTPLKNAAIAAGLGAPYFVNMQSSYNMTSPTPDAQSNYSINGGGPTPNCSPFSGLIVQAQDAWRSFSRSVPLVSAGWNGYPRILNPVSWASTGWYGSCYGEGTPAQIAEELTAAVNDVKASPSQYPANTILIYAWNEFDEGGWICPGLSSGVGATPTYEGAARLNAIAQVLVP